MKKILSIAVASLAFAAVANYAAPQIGVTTITATSKNTIIPVPFKALSDGTSAITATDLVKTNSLPDNTWLLSYNGTNYKSFRYSGGVWEAAIYASESGTMAGLLTDTLTCGSAIWIILPTAQTYNTAITVYGAYTEGVTSTVEAGGTDAAKATLVANPLQSAATIGGSGFTPVNGDQLIIPSTTAIYSYKTNKTGANGQWRKDGAQANLPTSFAIGEGFWYVRAANAAGMTISWSAAQGN